MNKNESTDTEVNIRSMTTASDTWLSRYLVVDYTLETLQALVHIVTIINFTDRTKLQKFIHHKNFIFNVNISPNLQYILLLFYHVILVNSLHHHVQRCPSIDTS